MPTTVVIQYRLKGKPFSVDMGEWETIPAVGDELSFDNGILIVTKRRWKVAMQAWERRQKVALLCRIKEEGDE